jgi:hypothetical protein
MLIKVTWEGVARVGTRPITLLLTPLIFHLKLGEFKGFLLSFSFPLVVLCLVMAIFPHRLATNSPGATAMLRVSQPLYKNISREGDLLIVLVVLDLHNHDLLL